MPVVVVTGGSEGIGADLVRALVKLPDYRVVAVARRKNVLDQVAHSTADPSRVLVHVADVTDRKQLAEVVSACIGRFGDLNVWVNNVGLGLPTTVSKLTDADIDSMMKINVNSALYGIQASLPHFKSKGAGQIINISSLLGRNASIARGTFAAYCGAKHFLNALTDSLRAELKDEFPGITVTTVSPGLVATDFGLHSNSHDNRTMEGAQESTEVADVIVSAIQERGTDYYTRAEHKGWIDAYVQSLGKA